MHPYTRVIFVEWTMWRKMDDAEEKTNGGREGGREGGKEGMREGGREGGEGRRISVSR